MSTDSELKKTKVQKKFPDFVEMVDSMSVADLEGRINIYAKELEKVRNAQDEDKELNNAKELAKELSAPYRDAKKAIELKISYIITLIGEKGGDAENDLVKSEIK